MWARTRVDDRGPGTNAPRCSKCRPVSRCTHAVAFNHTSFDRILEEVAEDREAFERWLDEYVAVDQYLPRRISEGAFDALVVHPRVASQPALTQYPDADLALDDRYVI